MKMLKYSLLALVCLFIGVACGDNSTNTGNNAQEIVDEKFPEPVYTVIDTLGRANLTESQQILHKYLQEVKQDMVTEDVLSAQKLIDLYPTSIGELSIFDQGGEVTESLGAIATLTKTTYRKGNQIARVNLIDTGGHPASLLAVAPWASRAIDRQEETFTERTRTFRGFPAYERWLPKFQQSNFDYVIGNRYVISIQGKNMDMAMVEEVAKFLSPAKLRATAAN